MIAGPAHFAEMMVKTPDIPGLTEAIKLGLQNAAHHTESEVSLRERVAALRAKALAKATHSKRPALSGRERYAFWTR